MADAEEPYRCETKTIPKLWREEIEQTVIWIDDYLEDDLELSDKVKAKP